MTHEVIHALSPLTLTVTEVAVREPGSPTLRKPAALLGVPQTLSILYVGRARSGVFVRDGTVWIRHRGYLSPTIVAPGLDGAPLSVRMKALGLTPKRHKFVYDDN